MALFVRGITRGVESEEQLPGAICRLRLTFRKEGAARYISHLDLARALERSLNRAGLPVAYTQGFNRRPRLSLAAALPLGYTSEAEVADVWLTKSVGPEAFLDRLRGYMAPGISLVSASHVPLTAPSLQQQMAESIYEIHFLDAADEFLLREKAEALLASPSIVCERSRPKGNKTQSIDLRPLILGITLRESNDAPAVLVLHLVHTANLTGKPDDVLAAMGFDPLDCRVHRLGLRFAGSDAPSA